MDATDALLARLAVAVARAREQQLLLPNPLPNPPSSSTTSAASTTITANPTTPINAHTFAADGKPRLTLPFIPGLQEALGFVLPDLSADDALPRLRADLAAHGVDLGPGSADRSLPQLLDRLAGRFLEPQSVGTGGRPLYVTHHPECMSPLAKSFVCPETGQAVAARAELFWDGIELANMYEEENDPFAQRAKLERQARLLRRGGADAGAHADADAEAEAEARTVVDEAYLAALESGLPPTGGWGCGVDRLVMLFSGATNIRDVLAFGNLRNVVGASTPKG